MLNILIPVLGYISGSFPFSVWITRYVKNVDVRDAGFGWGALVLIFDIAKGFIPTLLAIRYSNEIWVLALTAGLTVVSHCWPLFVGFRSGMGLATLCGTLLAANWFVFIVGLGLLLTLTVTIRHSARASVFTGIFLLKDLEFWIALAGGVVIAYRFLIDWNRQYRELWLDRDQTQQP